MLTFRPISGVSGDGLIASGRKGDLGTINVGGRNPGRWRADANAWFRSVSPEEMMEIAQKCAELKEKGK